MEKIIINTATLNNTTKRHTFKGSNFECGYYAFIDANGEFVIGEERGREGGELYRGNYMGENTPHLNAIKKENYALYNSIIVYFNEQYVARENAIMRSATLSDMQKLKEIFDINKEGIKKYFPNLYYAILAVLDGEKETKPLPDYFK